MCRGWVMGKAWSFPFVHYHVTGDVIIMMERDRSKLDQAAPIYKRGLSRVYQKPLSYKNVVMERSSDSYFLKKRESLDLSMTTSEKVKLFSFSSWPRDDPSLHLSNDMRRTRLDNFFPPQVSWSTTHRNLKGSSKNRW